MPRVLGVDIPNNKRIAYALTYIYGIGLTRAEEIIEALNIDPATRSNQLTEEDYNKVVQYVQDQGWVVEGDLRREISGNLKRLAAVKSYRGLRHQRGLPVRGQRTSTNARTRKGGRRTIGMVVKK